MSDWAVWPGAVPSDAQRSDLVNKHMKRDIAIHRGDSFNSIQNLSQAIMCAFDIVFMIEIYLFLESDMLWEFNNTKKTTQYKKLDRNKATLGYELTIGNLFHLKNPIYY